MVKRGKSAQDRAASHAPEFKGLRPFFVPYAVVVFFVVFSALFNDVVWLPPERVRIGNSQAVIAYEISRNDDRVLLLLDETRRVRSVSPDRIASQQPCRLTGLVNSSFSLWVIMSGEAEPGSPVCP